MTFRWGHKSPIPIERLIPLKTAELVQALKRYVDNYEYPGSFDSGGLEGLVETFKNTVKKKL